VTRTPLSGSKGQGHQAALLTATLTREAGAAVTVRTYWAWETTATLRLLGGAQGGAGEGRGHRVATRTSLLAVVAAAAAVAAVTTNQLLLI